MATKCDQSGNGNSGSGNSSKSEKPSGFMFRESKLTTVGRKIEETWAKEKKPTGSEESAGASAVPIPSIFGKPKASDEKSNQSTEKDKANPESSSGFVFGSKICERVTSDENVEKESEGMKSPTASRRTASAALTPEKDDKKRSKTSPSPKQESPNAIGKTDSSEIQSDGFKDLANKAGNATEFSEKLETSSAGTSSAEPGKFGEKAQPILKEVEVKTGEEHERNIFHAQCKLHKFIVEDQKWAERGSGTLKINDSQEGEAGERRIVMRVQGSLRLVLNSKLWPEMLLERVSSKRVKISATDPDSGEVHLFLLSSSQSDSEQTEQLIRERLDELKASKPAETSDTSPKGRKRKASDNDTSSSPKKSS